MTADLQVAAWGLAVAVPVALNAITKRSADALGLSVMLLLIWTFSRVLWSLSLPPESMRWYPLIDAMAGATTFSAWMTRRAVWKALLTALFVAQCALHAAFWMADAPRQSLLLYIALNNGAFALQLCCVAWPGGQRVADSVVAGLSHLAWRRHHART